MSASLSPAQTQRLSFGQVANFVGQQRSLGRFFDPSLASTKEHRAALSQLESLFGSAVGDARLSDTEQQRLAESMGGVYNAGLDAHFDTQGYGDPGFYEPAKAAPAKNSQTAPAKTGQAAPELAAPVGRYEAAPSRAEVAGGAEVAFGQKGPAVGDLQQKLIDGGFYEGLYPEGTDPAKIKDGMFGPKTQAAYQAWQASQADGSEAAGVEGEKGTFGLTATALQVDTPRVMAGRTDGVEMRDMHDRVIADDAQSSGVGIEGSAQLVGVRGHAGDSQDVGVEGRAEIAANVFAGFEGQRSATGGKMRGGAYAGVDAEGSVELGLRYFGIGVRGSVGKGAGTMAEFEASRSEGRIGMGAFVKSGFGVTGGLGGNVWIDYGKIKEDALAVKDKVASWFSGIGD